MITNIKNLRIYASHVTLLLALGTLAGCSVHDVETNPVPKTPIPAEFTQNTNHEHDIALDQPWWESLNRPILNALIEKSFEENQNLKQALAVIEQSMALAEETEAGQYPQIDLEGDITQNWRGSDQQDTTGDIGAALDWELDIFNRIGDAARADRLEAQADIERARAVKLSLSAEVANAYFGAAAAQKRLKLLEEQLDLDRDLLRLLDLRQENGIGTSVDVLQQKARVAESETLIPIAQSDLAVFENRLDVLMGQVPDGYNRVPEEEELDFSAKLPSIGIPAKLLLNRPDLRASKADLVAADADIGSAIAERLPNISFDASYLYSDSNAFRGPVSMIMGSFVQPLLDWGERKARVTRNKAIYKERLANFSQNFLEAVEAVENALTREIYQREFIKRLKERRDILRKTTNETEARYRQGVDDYLPVINALQELRIVERNLIDEELELINTRIALFRAIGGPIEERQNTAVITPPKASDTGEDKNEEYEEN